MASTSSTATPLLSHSFTHTLKFNKNATIPPPKRREALQIRASSSKLSSLPLHLQLKKLGLKLRPPDMVPADPDFYRIGYLRNMRAFGIEYLEGPDGFGVFASKDIEPLRRARLIMEIPLELMMTITQKKPWMFFPDVIPIGHPIFDIINSTDPETEEDLRLACLLLYAMDKENNFWQLYGDFLPGKDELTSLLLANEEDLDELQDQELASKMEENINRATEFWEKHWYPAAPLKIRRLAFERERFLWALGIVQSRFLGLKIRLGALIPNVNALVPYADMLNHSFKPNCFIHWRFRDRVLQIMINAGQRVNKGEELTINYFDGAMNNMLMEKYGFSSPTNPWDTINFSSQAKIHLDTYLSVFNISGLEDEYYHNLELSNEEDRHFIDGAVIAGARTLPTWSDRDVPMVPSFERKAARELQEECNKILGEYPTTIQQDQLILDTDESINKTREVVIKYRMHRKLMLEKLIEALEVYQDRLLF
ncbi:hypothetical protein LUZ60_008915 [Juncus effusus]|nr:hypothetical protein LUZ60_008915 [Juncus effusus]